MTQLGPGIYVDALGCVHIYPAEIAENLGLPKTPAVLEGCESGALRALRKQFPNAVIQHVVEQIN
jgi:hypothetical protein